MITAERVELPNGTTANVYDAYIYIINIVIHILFINIKVKINTKDL